MKLTRLTALFLLCVALIIGVYSCEKDSEQAKVNVYMKSGISINGAQQAPVPVATPATGLLSVSYDKRIGVLNYSFTWTGLKDTITGVAIHGPAPVGYASATIKQSIAAFGTDLKANQKSYPYQGGSYNGGTLMIDGVNLKETELLSSQYYLNIRTKAFPTGEIRAQITFQ